MVPYVISFFQIPKVVLSKLDYFQSPYSFGKGIVKKKIYWLDGVWFSVQKNKEGWVFMTFRLKTQLLLDKCLFKLLTLKMGYGKHFSSKNTLAQMPYHRFIGNLVTHTIWLV